ELAINDVRATEVLGGIRVFDDELRIKRDRHDLVRSILQEAIRTGEGLEIGYQPQVEIGGAGNTASGKVVGVEALLRINHWQEGRLGPEDFLPVARACGLLEQLDHWAMHQAIAHLSSWPGAELSLGM